MNQSNKGAIKYLFQFRRTGKKIQKEKNKANKKIKQQCSICFEDFSVYKGTIEGCEHTFCFRCIESWSKKDQTCPICRQEFKSVREENLKTGEIKQMVVQPLKKILTPEDYYQTFRNNFLNFTQLMDRRMTERNQLIMVQSTILDYYSQRQTQHQQQ